LLATFQLVKVILNAGEESLDFGPDLREERGLCSVEVRLGDEFEVLKRVSALDQLDVRTCRTRVVWRTLDKRGKSFVASSRMLMEESSSCMELRREPTQPSSAMVVFVTPKFASDTENPQILFLWRTISSVAHYFHVYLPKFPTTAAHCSCTDPFLARENSENGCSGLTTAIYYHHHLI
jgi:hypothetical protein